MKIFARSAALAVALAAVAPAHAAAVIDQYNYGPGSVVSTTGDKVWVQSFQQSTSNIAGAGIFSPFTGQTYQATFTFSIYDGLPINSPNLLVQGTGVGTGGNWIDAFWAPVSLTPGTTYYLAFHSPQELTVAGTVSPPDPGYANGQASQTNGSPISGPGTTADFSFRTYAVAADTTAVPEPATWGTMLLGLGIVGAGMRRNRRKAIVAHA